SAIGSSAAGVELVETGASVLLEARKISSNREEKKQERIRFVDGCLFCVPDYEDFLEGSKEKGPRVERFGAAGVFEIAREVAGRRAQAADALSPHSPSKKILHAYVTRDTTGAVAAVALES